MKVSYDLLGIKGILAKHGEQRFEFRVYSPCLPTFLRYDANGFPIEPTIDGRCKVGSSSNFIIDRDYLHAVPEVGVEYTTIIGIHRYVLYLGLVFIPPEAEIPWDRYI